jgi:hypothetical protein
MRGLCLSNTNTCQKKSGIAALFSRGKVVWEGKIPPTPFTQQVIGFLVWGD